MIPSDFPPIVDTQMEEIEEEKVFKNVKRKLFEDLMEIDEIEENKENINDAT